MANYLVLLFGLWSAAAFSAERVIINPDSNGDLKLKVNIGGTPTDALVITGSTGAVSIPNANFSQTANAATTLSLTVNNTNATNNARVFADVGSGTGDAYFLSRAGGVLWSAGIDQSDTQAYVLTVGNSPSAADPVFKVTTGGDATLRQGTSYAPAFLSGTGLRVSRTATATIQLATSANSTRYAEIFHDGTQMAFNSVSSGVYMAFNTVNAERMRIDASGNVGIGATPGTKLEVADGTSAYLTLRQITGGNPATGLTLGRTADPLAFFEMSTATDNKLTGSIAQDLIIRTSGGSRSILFGEGSAQYMKIAGGTGEATHTNTSEGRLNINSASITSGIKNWFVGTNYGAVGDILFRNSATAATGSVVASDAESGTTRFRIRTDGDAIFTPTNLLNLSGITDNSLTVSANATAGDGIALIAKADTSAAGNRPLSIFAMGQDANNQGDMIFDTRTVANGAFTDTTFDAFRFRHSATDLINIKRNGDTSFAGNVSSAKQFRGLILPDINDNAVTTRTGLGIGSFMLTARNSPYFACSGWVQFEDGNVNILVNGGALAAASGVLTGTTGTDNFCNVSHDDATDTIYIENRFGTPVSLNFIAFGQ